MAHPPAFVPRQAKLPGLYTPLSPAHLIMYDRAPRTLRLAEGCGTAERVGPGSYQVPLQKQRVAGRMEEKAPRLHPAQLLCV